MSGLKDKSVLITGASSGIGAALAQDLVRRGARVGLLARRKDRLVELAEELREAGGEVAWAVADVTDDYALAGALSELDSELGGTDVVVANAGYGRPDPPHKFKPGAAIAMYDTNLFGMLRVIDWVLPRFIEAGQGHIVGVASVASYVGFTNSAAYCGSKAAMRVHLQSLRVSLANHGIAVTTICPGFVKSELTDKNKFKMPFIWETEPAARLIGDAIERRRGEVVFPWQMRWLKQLLVRWMPVGWLEALLRRGATAKR
ncbi:MAG: SDR family NAD(P)-dependent oxidoreductase [Acidobacteriota bacterium]